MAVPNNGKQNYSLVDPSPEMVPSMAMASPLPWQFPNLSFPSLHFLDPIASEQRTPFNAGAAQLIVKILCNIGW
jgi:hypothetical protein